MIRIQPLGSSSAGNSYLIDDGHTRLLLEAGIRYRDIQRGIGFQTASLGGCLITHEHGDHCKSVKDVLKAGIDVYASYGTWDALKLDGHHRAHPVKSQQPFTIGTWTVLPFDVQHDVSEPLGYLLANQAGDKLVFLSDTYYCRYRFSGLTHVMVECNYSLDVLNANVATGKVPYAMKKRLMKSHFSLENMLDFLRANDLRKVEEIWLLHLSDTNADEDLFKRTVQEATGKLVYVARR